MLKAIIGYGGHAKEVAAYMNDVSIFFVDDPFWKKENVNVFPISEFDPDLYQVIVAIGDPITRKYIVNKLPNNTKYFTYVHQSSLIFKDVEIGEGSFIGANCILTNKIKIGKHSILNRAVSIGHDCCLGNYFSSMPGSVVSGNVTIGEQVYLGNNSSVKEGLKICNNVTIGMNGAVVKNIESPGVYVGVPVKKI